MKDMNVIRRVISLLTHADIGPWELYNHTNHYGGVIPGELLRGSPRERALQSAVARLYLEGWQVLGGGSFQLALIHKDDPSRVLKVQAGDCDDASETYNALCLKMHQAGTAPEWMPEVYAMGTIEGTGISFVWMKRYLTLADETHSMGNDGEDDTVEWFTPTFHQEQEIMDALRDQLDDVAFDIHPKNMGRCPDTGVLVALDPVWG